MKQSVWLKEDFNLKIAINIVDNGSQDGTPEFIKKNYPYVHVLKNINNLGFSRAYNQAIKMYQTDWVLVMNVDVILDQDFLEKMFLAVKNNKDDIAAFGAKILKIESVIKEGGLVEIKKSNKIDSCGLGVKKSRQVFNLGENKLDSKKFNSPQEVFGFSGCCTLFRQTALRDVAFKQEYYDEDFFAYQEDFDLAYRLQLLGWKAKFIPDAQAYHFRSAQYNILNPLKFWKIRQARKAKSAITNYHSYKNHFYVLYKNEIAQNFWKHFLHIFWFEFKKFVYLLIFETKSLTSLKEFFKNRKKMKLKREIIQERRKVSAEEILKWFK